MNCCLRNTIPCACQNQAHLHIQLPQVHHVSRSERHHLACNRVEGLAVHLGQWNNVLRQPLSA